jgi:DNA-binding MarR family transcriptional regulator
MGASRARTQAVSGNIITRLLREHSTAAVLFHHAIADRLGLGPTDHKCLDLLRERGPMISRELATLTGLTSGAITGVVSRLEEAGYLRRDADPEDQRKQLLTALPGPAGDLEAVFHPIHREAAVLLEDFDAKDLAAIAEFLTRSVAFLYRQGARLRAEGALMPPRPASGASAASHARGHDHG